VNEAGKRVELKFTGAAAVDDPSKALSTTRDQMGQWREVPKPLTANESIPI
jgi:hypothetical protein